jgi:hypothetical protein
MVYTKPFTNRILNFLEYLNEITILILTYHLIVFTDFVDDPNLRYSIGWSALILTAINILTNMLVMITYSAISVKQNFKQFIRIINRKAT